MNAKTTRWRLLAAALASGLLLAGCDADGDGYDDATGQPVAAVPAVGEETDLGGCDPSGFGPLSGCSDNQTGPGFVPDADLPAGWIDTAARHEAGHKVVADEYGFTVTAVELHPDGSGATDVVWTCNCPVKRIAVLVAGEVASGTTEGADVDAAAVNEVLATVPPLEQDGVLDAAYAEADRIVNSHSAEIDQIAADLLEDGRLG